MLQLRDLTEIIAKPAQITLIRFPIWLFILLRVFVYTNAYNMDTIWTMILSANCASRSLIDICLYLGPSKSITAPAWYQVTLLGGRSCSSMLQIRLIVLPFLIYSSWGPVILACISDRNNDNKTRGGENCKITRLALLYLRNAQERSNYYPFQILSER